MARISRCDTELCKQLALWIWVAAGAAFLVLMYASFGWIGPAPAFLIWTAGALPLFLVTWWWQLRVGLSASAKPGLLTLVVWLLLTVCIPVIQTPINQAPTVLRWLLMAAPVIFPVTVAWTTIKAIDGHRPRSRTAA